MKPLNPAYADRQYVVGEVYRLVPYADRSPASHNHYFACIHDAWVNLPEGEMDRFPSAEHLRKWALIKSGYCTQETFVAKDVDEAIRLAIRFKEIDDYTVVLCSLNCVTRFEAKSQKRRAMGKKEFQESKDKVLDQISRLIGTSVDDLKANAKRVA